LGAAGFDAAPKVGNLKPAELPLLVAGAAGFGVEAGEFEASAARRCRMPRSVLPEETAPLLKDSSSDSEPVLDAVMLFSSYTWVTNKRLCNTNIRYYCIRYYCIRYYCIRYYCIRYYCIRYYCIRYYCTNGTQALLPPGGEIQSCLDRAAASNDE
jgi:hypothetical protein